MILAKDAEGTKSSFDGQAQNPNNSAKVQLMLPKAADREVS